MIDSWESVRAWYLNASREERMHWISLLIFYMTVVGRGSYRPGTEELADPPAMARLNVILHSVSSYLLVLVEDSEYGFSDHLPIDRLSQSLRKAGLSVDFFLPHMMKRVRSPSSTGSKIGVRVERKRIEGTSIENWKAAKRWYPTASIEERIRWLLVLVFKVSAFGRETGCRGMIGVADTGRMRRINEFIHRLSGYVLCLIEDEQPRMSDDSLLGYIYLAASEVRFEWRDYQPRPFEQPE